MKLNLYEKFKKHCEKGAILKAIGMAEELRDEEYRKIMSVVPNGQDVPQPLVNVIGANKRLVSRLQRMLIERFPPKEEPRFKKKLR